ncbi:MAG: hypothetical protein ACLTAI_02340 [Thomasclavelia sp.]
MTDEDFPIMIRSYKPGDVIVTSGGTKKYHVYILIIKFLKAKEKTGQSL